MVLFSPSELLVLLKTEQLFKVGSISYLARVQSEFPSGKSYTLVQDAALFNSPPKIPIAYQQGVSCGTVSSRNFIARGSFQTL